MRVDLQSAYILHAKPYRDTSLILDFLTPDFGRVAAVARGVRKNKTPKRQLLNPFSRLLISWQGKGEMKLLTGFESDNHFLNLAANHLYSGFYLNELLVRLLPEADNHNQLYFAYEQCLQALANKEEIEPLLRKFEFRLLEELGYGLNFMQDARSGEPIVDSAFYRCHAQEGFFCAQEVISDRINFLEKGLLKGSCLQAIAEGNYVDPEVRMTAKYLTRQILKPLLGSRPLKTRELFLPNIQD